LNEKIFVLDDFMEAIQMPILSNTHDNMSNSDVLICLICYQNIAEVVQLLIGIQFLHDFVSVCPILTLLGAGFKQTPSIVWWQSDYMTANDFKYIRQQNHAVIKVLIVWKNGTGFPRKYEDYLQLIYSTSPKKNSIPNEIVKNLSARMILLFYVLCNFNSFHSFIG
jgi:hypothetical protein